MILCGYEIWVNKIRVAGMKVLNPVNDRTRLGNVNKFRTNDYDDCFPSIISIYIVTSAKNTS
jgi:hypothetical protein